MKMHSVLLWLIKYWKLDQMFHQLDPPTVVLRFSTGGRLS